MKLVNTIVLTSILSVGSLFASSYKVDESHSDVSFKVKPLSPGPGIYEPSPKLVGVIAIQNQTKG
jgi:polyisoprenoid-binding protein YceI